MRNARDRIENQLREQICPKCRGSRPDGSCDLSGEPSCALMERLNEIMSVVSAVRDYSLEPYQEQIREVVCSSCREDESGNCTFRDEGNCALDAFFPEIVAIIEKELAADPGLA